jgi:hypothetical protein
MHYAEVYADYTACKRYVYNSTTLRLTNFIEIVSCKACLKAVIHP